MFFDKIIDFEEVIYLPIQVSKTHITAKQKSAPRAIHRADHKRERKKQKILSKTFVRPSIYSTWFCSVFFAHICFWWLFPQSTKTFLERFVLFFCEKEKKMPSTWMILTIHGIMIDFQFSIQRLITRIGWDKQILTHVWVIGWPLDL